MSICWVVFASGLRWGKVDDDWHGKAHHTVFRWVFRALSAPVNVSHLALILQHCLLTMATWPSTWQYVRALADPELAAAGFVTKTSHRSVHHHFCCLIAWDHNSVFEYKDRVILFFLQNLLLSFGVTTADGAHSCVYIWNRVPLLLESHGSGKSFNLTAVLDFSSDIVMCSKYPLFLTYGHTAIECSFLWISRLRWKTLMRIHFVASHLIK